MADDDVCTCGHLRDEHITEEPSAPCDVDECPCVAFEENHDG